jgi:hypothetical protein
MIQPLAPEWPASAFLCIPDGVTQRVPVIFCHHQHAGRFDLGQSEVVGLRGSPDQAHAAELARQGYLTIAPDAMLRTSGSRTPAHRNGPAACRPPCRFAGQAKNCFEMRLHE